MQNESSSEEYVDEKAEVPVKRDSDFSDHVMGMIKQQRSLNKISGQEDSFVTVEGV